MVYSDSLGDCPAVPLEVPLHLVHGAAPGEVVHGGAGELVLVNGAPPTMTQCAMVKW